MLNRDAIHGQNLVALAQAGALSSEIGHDTVDHDDTVRLDRVYIESVFVLFIGPLEAEKPRRRFGDRQFVHFGPIKGLTLNDNK